MSKITLCISGALLSLTMPIKADSLQPTNNQILKQHPLVSLYQQSDKPEKGPIRIQFAIHDNLATKVEWDEDFKKRHLILRAFKKGFTGHMYRFESDLMAAQSQCDSRNQQAHVNVALRVKDIISGYSKNDFMDFYQLKLESTIHYSYEKFETTSADLGYIKFNERRKGRLKLSQQARKNLQKHGEQTAKSFIKAKLPELIGQLHQGIDGSQAQIKEQISVCQQALDANLDTNFADANT